MSSDATLSIQAYEKSELEAIYVTENNPNKDNMELHSIESSKTIINDFDSVFVSFNEKSKDRSKNEERDSRITYPNDEIIFSMGKDTLKYDLKTVLKACPVLVAYISQIQKPNAKITINLPQWITRNALFEYFVYYKKNTLIDSSSLNYYTILRLSDCFENTTLLNKVIKTKIIPTLSFDSALLFLQESYQKIEQNNMSYNWYELFSTTKEFISSNIIQYIQSDDQKFNQLRRVLLEEIIEHHILMTNDLEGDLIDFLMKICHCANIFDLIAYETLSVASDENTESLVNSSYCLIQYVIKESITNGSSNTYQELKKKYNKSIDVTFFVYYKSSDDIFNVNFKIQIEDKSKLFSFSILCYFENEYGKENNKKRYITNKIISNNKGNINILQINHFKEKKSSKLIIHIKMNAIHSFTLQYVAFNFKSYHSDPNIVKLPLMLLRDMLCIAKSLLRLSGEDVLASITLWLCDEINSNDEALNRLFEIVDWFKIKKSLVYTFIVKHSSIIDRTELSSFLVKDLKIEEAVLEGIRQANYIQLQKENNQLRKTLEHIKFSQLNLHFDDNKEPSEIKKIKLEQMNNLFSESDKEEARDYLPQSSKYTKHSFNRNRMRNKAQDMSSLHNSINQVQCKEPMNKAKTFADNNEGNCYQPIKTIEYEINCNKSKEINMCKSINHDILQSPTHYKLNQLKDSKQKKGTFGNILNTMQSCSLQNNNYKTKETSTVTQRSNQSIQSDKSLSSIELIQTRKTSAIPKQQRNENSANVSKQKRLISFKKAKPQIVDYYKTKFT